ncbi:MAG: secondary thiamine-phosphate synthase enzyme YjbQ [Candidatus Methylacidiphilales bacterium]|nr:secondary thiamine-phosphate synthase enzyme YjbQ [Candidatus Methylacidiphilales bacterium]
MADYTSITESFNVRTTGKGTYQITDKVAEIVRSSGVRDGVATVFIAHTSASLVIYENADRTAREDLHDFFEELVPEDRPYIHDAEGPDDSTSHLRMALTRTSEVVPIARGRLCLGTWQGIYVFEHRRATHSRTLWVNVSGVRG